MELLAVEKSDYCTRKVVIAAALAGQPLTQRTVPQADILEDGRPVSLMLRTASGETLTQQIAIMKYLVKASPSAPASLLGCTPEDADQVEHFLQFSWNQLGKPIR